jgi:hypothetical protein
MGGHVERMGEKMNAKGKEATRKTKTYVVG